VRESPLVRRWVQPKWAVVALPALGAAAMFTVLGVGVLQKAQFTALLLRGESDLVLEDAHRSLRSVPGPPDSARLLALVESRASEGLRFVGMVRPDGEVVAASTASAPGFHEALGLRPGEATIIDDEAWVRSRPLPPPPDQEPRPRGPPLTLLVGFQPRLVAKFERSASAALVVGLIAGLGLLALSLFASSLQRGRDDALQRLAHERRLAALGTMSAVVAHELRNPLATLKGHAQLLVESLAPHPVEKAQAQHVVDAAWRLERLSESLLELARTGAINATPVSPVEVVRAAIAHLEPSRVVLETSAAPTSWRLDATRLRQVVLNLVENALQAAPQAPVEVRVATEATSLVIEVRDHGPGVPPSERERIFEPFVTTRVKGVGLGLALARQVVALHGGAVEVVDARGGGACFRVTVPSELPQR
jgi:two-component system sensor histidine kinase HydH